MKLLKSKVDVDILDKDPVFDYRKRLLEKINIQSSIHGLVLDIGCGDGEDARLLSRYSYPIIALDINQNDNWLRKKTKKIFFNVADAQNLPLKKHQFNCVFIKDVLHHVYNPEKVLSEIKRVVKPDGIIIIVEANRFNPIFYLHMTLILGHQHLTRKKFHKIINNSFPKVKFGHFECRVYPIKNLYIRRICHKFENLVERIPALERFLTYNYAIVELK